MSLPAAQLLCKLCFVCIRPILTNVFSVEHFCPLNIGFNRALISANLASNDIGDEGAIAISTALESNTTLTDLNLQARVYGLSIVRISATGAQAIAKMLVVNRALKSANLGHNKICDEGAAALSEVLKFNNTLETLMLPGNEIGDAGAQSLAGMLQVNRALTSLDLTSNWIGAGGAKAIAAALPQS